MILAVPSPRSTEAYGETAGGSVSGSPVVSVVICAYNVAPYIRDAVDSALEQTYEDIEVVVVDDGSTDGGADLLSGIDDPRLRIEKRPHSGHGASLNAGIALARGRYVGLLTRMTAGFLRSCSGTWRIMRGIRRLI